MGKLRCAVIGTGDFVEAYHIPGLQSHPDAEVVAICGNADRARAVAAALSSGIERPWVRLKEV